MFGWRVVASVARLLPRAGQSILHSSSSEAAATERGEKPGLDKLITIILHPVLSSPPSVPSQFSTILGSAGTEQDDMTIQLQSAEQ